MLAPAGGGGQASFQGLPGYDGVDGPATPQAASAVDKAVDQIQQDIGGQGFFGTDRNGHMHDVVRTLDGLTPPERDAVVAKLSDKDLKSLLGDVDHGGVLGAQGLSSGEKTDLFNTLAGSLSGTQLSRVARATRDRDDIERIGQAVSAFSTNDVKASFVANMASQTTGSDSGTISSGIGYVSDSPGTPSAHAVGQVLASLKGDGVHFNAAVKALNDTQLAAVVQAGAGETLSTYSSGEGGAATTDSYDPKTLVGILDAAVTSHDAGVKARVFAAGAAEDGTIAGSNSLLSPNPTAKASAADVTKALQGVLSSDTNGVVNQLQIHNRNGTELATFLQQEIALGKDGQKTIGQDIARLQQGNGLNQSPIARMKAGSSGFFPHAENLGYFSGATQVAVRKTASAAGAQASLIGSIFSSAVGLATKPAGPVAGAAAGLLTSQAVSAVVGQVQGGIMKLGDAFSALAYPTDPKTGGAYQGAGEVDYDSASSRVINANP